MKLNSPQITAKIKNVSSFTCATLRLHSWRSPKTTNASPFIITISKELGLSWVVNNHLAGQEILRLLWKPKVHHRVHNSQLEVKCDISWYSCFLRRKVVNIHPTNLEDHLFPAVCDSFINISAATLHIGYRIRYSDWLRLDDWRVEVRVPVGSEFSLLQVVQTGSGVRATSYPMGTGGSFPGRKAAGAWSWSLTSSQYRG
jgi:hypothetical protein